MTRVGKQPGFMAMRVEPDGSRTMVFYRGATLPSTSLRTQSASVSKLEADAVKARVTSALEQSPRTGGPLSGVRRLSVSVRPDVGKVVVATDGDDQSLRALEALVADVGSEKVLVVREDLNLASRDSDAAPHYGGSTITTNAFVGGGYCTSGFTVTNAYGTRYMLTAAHCVLDVHGGRPGWRSWSGGYSFGNVTYWTTEYPSRDIALIDPGSYTNRIWTGGTSNYVIGANNPTGTEIMCMSGASSRTHCNITLWDINTPICEEGPGQPCNYGTMMLVDNPSPLVGGCAGDSGAPIYVDAGSSLVSMRGMFIAGGGVATTRVSPVNGATVNCNKWLYAERWSEISARYSVIATATP